MRAVELESAEGEIGRLQELGAGEPGSSLFPALAEAHRRAGRPDQAERVAREGLEQRPDLIAGRVALGLALLDAGRLGEARRELERALESVPDHTLALRALERTEGVAPPAPSTEPTAAALGSVDERELEEALEQAVPDPEQTVDADRIAQEAMRAANLERPEGLLSHPGSPFATRTVADLLESQGDAAGARAIRSGLERAPGERAEAPCAPQRAAPTGARPVRMIETLERWLDNLRRGKP